MTHLFLAFLYSTRFLSEVVTKISGFDYNALSRPKPLQRICASTCASGHLWRVSPSRFLFIWQPAGVIYFVVCDAVRHGGPQFLPLTIYSDPPWPAAWKGLMEKAPASAAGFRKKGEFPVVTLKRYWISRGQRSCLHSKFSISFMSRQPGDIWQQEEVKREAWHEVASYWLSLFFRMLSLRSPLPARLCLHLTLSPVCHLLTTSVCCKNFTHTQANLDISI